MAFEEFLGGGGISIYGIGRLLLHKPIASYLLSVFNFHSSFLSTNIIEADVTREMRSYIPLFQYFHGSGWGTNQVLCLAFLWWLVQAQPTPQKTLTLTNQYIIQTAALIVKLLKASKKKKEKKSVCSGKCVFSFYFPVQV